MTTHVQIELFSGPQDGRVITLPATSEGPPLPVPVSRGGIGITGETVTEPAGDDELEIAWYERSHRRGQGEWVYRYTSSHVVQPE